jgi:hypothetical protein
MYFIHVFNKDMRRPPHPQSLLHMCRLCPILINAKIHHSLKPLEPTCTLKYVNIHFELIYISWCNHRYITSRSNMSISADVHPWGDFSLLTAPPPTTSGVKSY